MNQCWPSAAGWVEPLSRIPDRRDLLRVLDRLALGFDAVGLGSWTGSGGDQNKMIPASSEGVESCNSSIGLART
jgi:hypothetical protein